ncbi:HTH_Tnp_Tc3_2 domain-containing protein [Trichonephila clavipes]|nr:HTH_Tnp_Tc3_2 domain-containing protein [Trichonephila clavipes]
MQGVPGLSAQTSMVGRGHHKDLDLHSREWYLTAAEDGKESFLHLLFRVKRKEAGLRAFEGGQIVMSLRFGTSISKTAGLIDCSCSAVFSIYAKWINNEETSNVHQLATYQQQLAVRHSRVIREKGRQKLYHLVKQNRCLTVAQPTAQCDASSSASVSEHVVQRTLFDRRFLRKNLTRGPLLKKGNCQLLLNELRNIETLP